MTGDGNGVRRLMYAQPGSLLRLMYAQPPGRVAQPGGQAGPIVRAGPRWLG